MSFLLLTRSFNQPISQVSNQINAIVMALAGAERIFELMDAEPEEDDGYVTLVNVRRKADGSLEERPEHTGLWAWKHPHKAEGTVTYTELKGDITRCSGRLRLRAGQAGAPRCDPLTPSLGRR